MKEQFVTYEIALILKEKGFNELCLGVYKTFGQFTLSKTEYIRDMVCTAPLWQQAINWLKSKRVLLIEDWYGWTVWEFNKGKVFFKNKIEAFNYALTKI